MKDIDFETFFKIQTIGMKLTLTHPDIKHDVYWFLKSIVIYAPYTMNFGFLFNSMLIDMTAKDYFNAFRNIVPVTIYISVTFEYLILVKHYKTIGKLMKLMKADFDRFVNMDERDKKAVHVYIANSSWIMKNWMKLMICSVALFIVKSTVLTVYHAINGQFRFVPFHEMHYIDYVDSRKGSNIFIYAGTFVVETYFTTACVMIYLCAVPLGPILMLHVCGLLELIIIKLENVFEKDDVDHRLKVIIQEMQYVYRFVADINTCFTFMYEIMLKQITILLPVISYALIKSISHGKFTIEYVTVLAAIASMSTPCYYSDKLMSKSEEVRQAAYACGWERCFIPSTRKTLLIILTRAHKSITIRSIFQDINLDTLSDVYRQAYTIFNVMTAMWD